MAQARESPVLLVGLIATLDLSTAVRRSLVIPQAIFLITGVGDVVTNPSDKDAKKLLALLGITDDPSDTVGLKCTPIPVQGNDIW